MNIKIKFKTMKNPHYLKISNFLSESNNDKVIDRFQAAYILEHSNPGSFNLSFNSETLGLSCIPITSKNIDTSIDFFLKIFQREISQSIAKTEQEQLKLKLLKFLSQSRNSFLFTFDNQIVGILGINENVKLSFYPKKVNHIGVIGYDRNLLTKDLVAELKSRWVNTLKDIGKNNLPFTARVDLYNQRSINFFKKMGFHPVFLELVNIHGDR